MSIMDAQCRAARAMLGWTQDRLFAEAGIAKATVVDFERGARRPMNQNLLAIRRAFEAAGLVFLDENGGGRGVRFSRPKDDDGESGAAE